MNEIANDMKSAVFGASGTLGRAVARRLAGAGQVVRLTRSRSADALWTSTSDPHWAEHFCGTQFNRVVWAQGANASGGIAQGASRDLKALFSANVEYIVDTLEALLSVGAVASGSSLCIVSSVWQLVARDSKLAYVTTKAAAGGLVRSLAADLGPQGVRVNAVLPGVVYSPMAQTFLDPQAIEQIAHETPTRRLVTDLEVADVVWWITGPDSTGVHGQSIPVDNGWSVVRRV